MPAGIVAYTGQSSAPSGWLKADGSAVSRTTYADLFSAIGTTWGNGDGATTFNVPDMRGVFARGYDNGRGKDSGRSFANQQDDALENLTGTIDDVTQNPGGLSASGAFSLSGSGTTYTVSGTTGAQADGISFDASVETNVSTETRPRNVAMLAIIKT